MNRWPTALYLEKGHLFEGAGFGARLSQGGEAVFNTGMTGYQEIFTDPSYHKQIVVMGYPHIGNTGINFEDVESGSLYLSGIAVREYCEHPSNWRSKLTLSDFLAQADVPGISEVDTREITEIIRDEGAQRGVIFPTENVANTASHGKRLLSDVESMENLELISRVSCKNPYEFEPNSRSHSKAVVVVYDYGVKLNICRHLKSHFRVWVVPHHTTAREVLSYKPLAVVLSNGPGDPGVVKGAVEEIQNLLGQKPILAICMGHQLLARALGAKTYKLKFGHHGVNHPVKDLRTGRIMITSQNHGFAVPEEDLKLKDVTVSHLNLNDRTVEGFSSEKMKFLSVQFHPEAAPGPSDASYLFDNFVRGFLR